MNSAVPGSTASPTAVSTSTTVPPNGARRGKAALLVVDQLDDSHPQKEVAGAYKAAYEGRYKDSISTFGGHAYDGLFIAVQAIDRAGAKARGGERVGSHPRHLLHDLAPDEPAELVAAADG